LNVATKREGFAAAEEAQVVEKLKPSPAPVIEPSPAETPSDTPLEDQWPVTVKLMYSKKLRDDQGNLKSELTFREPRGGDINRYGNPVRINQEGDIIIDERKMHFIMSALCGILPPLLEAIDPRDWNSCAYRLRTFFLPDPRAW
jgi:hypothetical protein